MAKGRGDFADILLKKKMLGPDQLADAEEYAASNGLKLQDALVKKEYLSANEVMSAIAEHFNMKFVGKAVEIEGPRLTQTAGISAEGDMIQVLLPKERFIVMQNVPQGKEKSGG